jgi:outer membrane protein assembly factor BamB
MAVATVSVLVTGPAVPRAFAATRSAQVGRTAQGPAGRLAAGSSAYDWPELHRDARLEGYAANGTVSVSNAGKLGVHWATDLYAAVADSPVVAYDPSRAKTLVYIGTDAGNLFAINKATGAIVWAVGLDGPVRASPLVNGGSAWVGTASLSSPTIYKLNASTGAIECSRPAPASLLSSPVAATPPGGTPSVYFAVVGGAGQVLAVSAATCAVQWTFSGYAIRSGTWDPLAYAVDATGEPLLLFGSANRDDAAYAVDAVTGAEIWRFQTSGVGDFDVGAGLTISPPGANGFAGGVVYVPGKDGFLYALNLTTGKQIWRVSLGSEGGVPNEAIATAALDGTSLVVGDAVGADDFNAVSGRLVWSYRTPVTSQIVPPGPSELISSPAICGRPGHEVVVFGDLGNAVRVLSLGTGKQLYHHRTGSWVTSSPAVSKGDILVGSSDGFLYDFSAGAGNKMPTTAITSPAYGATVANPGRRLTVRGTASARAGVAATVIAVRRGGADGTWWDAATSSWSPTPVTGRAKLASPGATSTRWRFSFPVPSSGQAYRVDAYALSARGPATVPATADEFAVGPRAGAPALKLSHRFAAPGGSVSVRGSGFGPSETVTISLLGTVVGQGTSRPDGSLPPVQATVPATAGFGLTALVAAGGTSRKEAAAPVDVTNDWPQLGGGPGRIGFEANDPVIQDTIDPGQNILLDPAWHYRAASALGSPTVADGVVYVGDRAGTLRALPARTGTPRWAWHTPTGAAITGSPAVDTTAGLAFVGAADGTLYAVSTSGGSAGRLAWSARLGGGHVRPPVFDGVTVYAVSTNGTVIARSEATGRGGWSAALALGAAAAPALDPAGGVLVVPTTGGVTALNAANGTAKWSASVTGATAPVLSAGLAYVGSSDHHVYALSESTGQQAWSFAAGGAIQGPGALGFVRTGPAGTLFFGSADGNLYALDPLTGAELSAQPLGATARGVAIAGSTALVTTSSGLVEAMRIYGLRNYLVVWTYATAAGVLSPPAVVDGTMFASAQHGNLWAFTPYGAPPP